MTAVMEDEALAEQGEEASLLAGCRNLLRAVTKVSKYSPPKILGPKKIRCTKNKLIQKREKASLLVGLLRLVTKV